MPRMPTVGRATKLASGTFVARPQLGKGRKTRKELVLLGIATQAEADARDLIIKQAVWNLKRSKLPTQAGPLAALLAAATTAEDLRDVLDGVRGIVGGDIVVAKSCATELPPGERISFEEWAMRWVRGEHSSNRAKTWWMNARPSRGSDDGGGSVGRGPR